MSAQLLDHYGIRTPRKALHEHNERARIDAVLGEPRARAGAGADLRCRHAAALRSRLSAGPRRARSRTCRSSPFRAPRRCSRRWRSPGLPTDAFGFIGFLPVQGRGARQCARGAQGSRAKRWCSTNRRAGSATRLPRWPKCSATIATAAVALELTKRFERVASRHARRPRRRVRRRRDQGRGGDPRRRRRRSRRSRCRRLAGGARRGAGRRSRCAPPSTRSPHSFGLKRKEVYDAALALKAEE